MTQRDFYNAIINGTVGEDEVAHAKAELVKLDEKNTKRASSNAKKKSEENAPIAAALFEVLTDEFQTTSELAKMCDISTSKATPCLAILVNEGKAVKTTVKVKGAGERVAYKRA